MMDGPVQYFRTAILEAWHFHVFSKLSERKGFRGVEFADLKGSLQLLNSTHLRDRDKMLLRAILRGRVWNGFLLGKAKKEDVPCRFCGKRDGDGHLFWECSFLALQHVRELPEFAFLMSLDRSNWPRCLLWHGWLPGRKGIGLREPWALSFGDLASFHLERCLGAYPVMLGLLLIIGMLLTLPWRCLIILMSGLMGAENIFLLWVVLKLLVFTSLLLRLLLITRFGERLKSMAMLGLCVAVLFYPSLGALQTVQRAEFWGAILAMQAYWPCHLGIDNLNVVRSIGRLLDADCLAKPLPLVKDGDLVALVQYMIRTRGRDTVRVTKVKGHAEDDDVQHGRVRLIDQQGNVEADLAADLGRRHQSEVLIDARRRLLQARGYWYPVIADLHRFMIATARVSLNRDGKGGTAPDPLVWDKGSRPKVRELAIRSMLILHLFLALRGF